jgi:hypothetical protein
LYARWPDRVGEVLALDEERAWLLLADAGSQLMARGNPPEAWLDVLARYAELQRAEVAHAFDHLAHRVPDLRMATLPGHYGDLVDRDLPVRPEEQTRLRAFAPRFAELCAELDACGVPATVQHDDLHMNNVFVRDAECRVLDWGDASIGHPFASIVVTFRFLEETNGLVAGDPWFARLRDAYLEPWGRGLTDVFELAVRVGTFAHLFASTRVRDFLAPDDRPAFDVDFRVVLRRALRQLDDRDL